MAFRFTSTSISEVLLIEVDVYPDERGWFFERYKRSVFRSQGIPDLVQDNHSQSNHAVLRGMHYQLNPCAQGKLVSVLAGEIFDVAVDIRKGSPTYRRWVGEYLSGENRQMLWIPAGFAHGFCVMSETAEVLYKTTAEYSPQHDSGIVWNDASLGIAWPVDAPVLSEKDRALPGLDQAENNFVY